MASEVPTINLQGLLGNGRSDVLRELARACEEWGCFQVVQHGVPDGVIEDMWAAARRFYEQPAEAKRAFMSTEGGKAMNFYEHTETNNEHTETNNYWLDILIVRRRPGICNGFEEAPEVFGKSLQKFGSHLEKLGNDLYTATLESLLGKQSVDGPKSKNGIPTIERAVLTLNFYPPCLDPNATKGFKEHTDVGTLTLLLQDEVGGLQAQSPSGEWVDLKFRPNVFVVLLADQMEILTNGRYRSCPHRVIANRSKLRISLPFTFGPPEDEFITPISKLFIDQTPCVYQGATFKDYMARYFDQSLPNNKKGLEFAKTSMEVKSLK